MKFGVISVNLREFSAFLLNFSQILRLNFERIYEFHAKFTRILKFQANFTQILKFHTKFHANFTQNSAKISREFLNFKPKFNAKFSVNFKGKNYA